jgi:hypothetical protein
VEVSSIWQRALVELEQSGTYVDPDEQALVENVRQEFENLSASIQDQPGYEAEAPKLAAWMVTYAIERDRMGLTDYESF